MLKGVIKLLLFQVLLMNGTQILVSIILIDFDDSKK